MKALRVVLTVALVAGLTLGLTGCSSDDDVAARVNGEVIKKSDLDAQINLLIEQYPDMVEGADGDAYILDFRQRLLNNMIDAVLIAQAADERGIEVSDSDVSDEVENLKTGFASDQEFNDALAQAGMDSDGLEAQVREQLVTELLIESLAGEVEVSDADIEDYYENNKDEQFSEEASFRASHILFDIDDKETAEQVLAEIKAGADFSALAKEHSQDPGSAEIGGDLGWPASPYVPEFQAAAEVLAVDEVSDLVESTFGWHIITILELRDEGVQPLDEVRDQIKQIILQQGNSDLFQQLLLDLRDEAEIEILAPELTVSDDADADTEESDGE